MGLVLFTKGPTHAAEHASDRLISTASWKRCPVALDLTCSLPPRRRGGFEDKTVDRRRVRLRRAGVRAKNGVHGRSGWRFLFSAAARAAHAFLAPLRSRRRAAFPEHAVVAPGLVAAPVAAAPLPTRIKRPLARQIGQLFSI